MSKLRSGYAKENDSVGDTETDKEDKLQNQQLNVIANTTKRYFVNDWISRYLQTMLHVVKCRYCLRDYGYWYKQSKNNIRGYLQILE